MEVKKSDKEKVYDRILAHLYERRHAVESEDIIRGTNDISKGIDKTLRRMEHLELIEIIEPVKEEPKQNILGSGYPLLTLGRTNPTKYKISEKGKEHVEDGGFKKSRTKSAILSAREWIGWGVALIIATLQLGGCLN